MKYKFLVHSAVAGQEGRYLKSDRTFITTDNIADAFRFDSENHCKSALSHMDLPSQWWKIEKEFISFN